MMSSQNPHIWTTTCMITGLPLSLSPSNLTHPFNEVNSWLQVETKVNEGPLDALHTVLLLLQDEHGVVEQLLELLVGVVDTQLLK